MGQVVYNEPRGRVPLQAMSLSAKEKIGVVNLPLLNNPLHHLVLTAYHRCVARNIIMRTVKFDCSGPATNHVQNLIDAVGINLFTVLIMTGCH